MPKKVARLPWIVLFAIIWPLPALLWITDPRLDELKCSEDRRGRYGLVFLYVSLTFVVVAGIVSYQEKAWCVFVVACALYAIQACLFLWIVRRKKFVDMINLAYPPQQVQSA